MGAGSTPAMGIVRGIFLLRKNKIFNKSRYARNRQTTRVAFYISILINILVIFVVFTLYYKVLLKLSLLWSIFFIFLTTFLVSSCLRSTPVVSLNNFLLFFHSFSVNAQVERFFLTSTMFDFFFSYSVVGASFLNYYFNLRLSGFMSWFTEPDEEVLFSFVIQ